MAELSHSSSCRINCACRAYNLAASPALTPQSQVQDPASFFDPASYAHAFNPEVGSVGLPTAATLRHIFPQLDQQRPPIFEPGLHGELEVGHHFLPSCMCRSA